MEHVEAQTVDLEVDAHLFYYNNSILFLLILMIVFEWH